MTPDEFEAYLFATVRTAVVGWAMSRLLLLAWQFCFGPTDSDS